MKQENSKKAVQKEENRWIDVHNDDVVREMGIIRPSIQTPRDERVWSKTPNERRLLKEVRHSVKRDMHLPSFPTKYTPSRGKLVVSLKRNKNFSKSTYSTECWPFEIDDILIKYHRRNNKTGLTESIISTWSFNGRTYGINERPV